MKLNLFKLKDPVIEPTHIWAAIENALSQRTNDIGLAITQAIYKSVKYKYSIMDPIQESVMYTVDDAIWSAIAPAIKLTIKNKPI